MTCRYGSAHSSFLCLSSFTLGTDRRETEATGSRKDYEFIMSGNPGPKDIR